MAIICPTVTAFDNLEYDRQLTVNASFADRVHVDLMDGIFTPTKSPELSTISLSNDVICDIHLMYRYPDQYFDQLIALKPNMVIIHFEAEVDHADFAQKLKAQGIKAGISLLANTPVEHIKDIAQYFDQILVFSGNLGYQGGSAVDYDLLDKVKYIEHICPGVEIAWDGGVSDKNAATLVESGVDVLNTGGYIQKADSPKANYEKLVSIVKDIKR